MKRYAFAGTRFARLLAPIALSILMLPSAFGDQGAEERRRAREWAEENRRNMKRREAEAKVRIEQGRDQGEVDLEEVGQWIQMGRDALEFSTQTAKAWTEQGSGEVPATLKDQGKRYQTRFLAVEKSYHECGTMLHSSSYVVSQVLRKIGEVKTEAKSVARDGARLCIATMNLHAGEGRAVLQGIDDDLKTAYAVLVQTRGYIQKATLKDLELALARETKHRKEAEGSSKKSRDKADRSRDDERAEWKAKQDAREAHWEAESARRRLESRIDELEGTYRDLVRRREKCGTELAASVDPSRISSGFLDRDYWDRRYLYWDRSLSNRSDRTFSYWDSIAQDVHIALEAVETLKTDVAVFGLAVSDLGNELSVPVGKLAGISSASAEGVGRPKGASSGSARRSVYSWTPWNDSDVLSQSKQ